MTEIEVLRLAFSQRYGDLLLSNITDEEVARILSKCAGGCSSVAEQHERAVVDMRFAIMEKQMRQWSYE